MVQGNLIAEKRVLRRRLLLWLKAVSQTERQLQDENIRRRIPALPQYKEAEWLFIFVGTGWEIDTWPLIEKAWADGKHVAVPRCLPAFEGQTGGGIMEACLIRNRQDLRPSPPLNLWEPAPGTPVLPPSAVDFALVPCVACDKEGYRLGRGGGYYDRFLAQGSFYSAAVCRNAVLQERLPREAHDERVDIVITETEQYPIQRQLPGNR